MSASDARGDWERNETEKERLDRNLEELLQGLRVAITGVQVLFAFLLVLPFQSGFPDVTGFQEKVYFGTLISIALASALLNRALRPPPAAVFARTTRHTSCSPQTGSRSRD